MDTSTQVTEHNPVKSPTGAKPKRQYRPIEEKRRIVEETLVEGASVARVALCSAGASCIWRGNSAARAVRSSCCRST